MKILITGICGFTGSTLAKEILHTTEGCQIVGIDNFIREGSRTNLEPLIKMGVNILEGDIRRPDDLDRIPKADWVIDCAAEPSVLGGVDGRVSSFDVMDNNLIGTIRVLEFCKRHQAGFILMSTSRVYSIAPLVNLTVESVNGAYRLKQAKPEIGLTENGISERFPTDPPLSLYGTSKKCSELLALEYGDAFGFPVWVNRCGVLAGAGQFGKADQGIFSFWIRSWRGKKNLKYIGFDGKGSQVRDCLHPRDLVPVLRAQMNGKVPRNPGDGVDRRISNFGGGRANASSLAQLSNWCAKRFGDHEVSSESAPRAFDLPWVVLDSSRAAKLWGFAAQTPLAAILEEIAIT
jgi:CDP-paratose 2-epimerase